MRLTTCEQPKAGLPRVLILNPNSIEASRPAL
jgi:hypothetical protein